MNYEGLLLILASVTLTGVVYGEFSPIAFTVAHNKNNNITEVSTVPYEKTLTIVSEFTNITNGVFTCTRAGFYKFKVFGTTYTGGRLLLDLYVNDKALLPLRAHANSDVASAGDVVIISLKVEDTVEVKTKHGYPVTLWGIFDINTFTGIELGSQSLHTFKTIPKVPIFSVTSSHAQDVAAGMNVLYDKKLVEDHDSLDLDTGVYTSQESGYYIVHFFTSSRQRNKVEFDLKLNDQYVCSVQAFTGNGWANGGNTAIVHLSKGDTLAVVSRSPLASSLTEDTTDAVTTFTGNQIINDADLLDMDVRPVIFFSVGLSRNVTVEARTPILFDKVLVDNKDAFDVNTGYFTAPVSGYYELNYHALGEEGKTMYLQLYQNAEIKAVIYSLDATTRPTAGNSIVLVLTAGDTVGIKPGGVAYLVGGIIDVVCTFSGLLLVTSDVPAVVGK